MLGTLYSTGGLQMENMVKEINEFAKKRYERLNQHVK